jgi:2',3'-cyclic-nucleotide 2'-phosphodiesterase (5'-nucleotidase family)
MFKLHLLHANDFEGGSRSAFNRADEFAAVWSALDERHDNTLKLSSGDAVLAGPIFDAGGAGSEELNNVLQKVNADVLGIDPAQLAGLQSDSGRPDTSILHALGVDAVTVGNHEFDAGPGGFAGLLRPDNEAENLESAEWLGTFFPYLSTNLDFSADEDLGDSVVDESGGFRSRASFVPDPVNDFDGAINDDKLASATTVDVNGEQIGVVGATTQAFNAGLISDTGGVTVDGTPGGDDLQLLAQQIQADVDQLTQQGVDKIVVQTHLQDFSLEQQLAPMLEDVDILMAGGSNAISANDFDQSPGQPDSTSTLNPGDAADAPYPQIIDGAGGSPTALISTDGSWEYVGNLVVEFDENGIIKPESIDETKSGPYAATQETIDELYDTPGDAFAEGTVGQQARDVVNATTNIVRQQDGNVAGVTDVVLNGERADVRSQETNLGNLTAEANLWYARQFEEEVDVSFKNGGGIRSSIADIVNNPDGTTSFVPPQPDEEIGKPRGGVSQISIGSALSFNNDLTLLTLTQQELVDLVASGTRAAEGQTGGFGQLAGLRYSYDPTAPEGERVRELSLVEGHGAPGQQVQTTTTLVENGEFVGNADQTVRIVTLNFLADVGSPVLTEIAGTDAANRVDLPNLSSPDALPNDFTFAGEGSEQDALAEFLGAFHRTDAAAFDSPDTPEAGDDRIENLLFARVGQVYSAYLGRAPGPQELATAVQRLQDGETIAGVARDLADAGGAPAFLANPTSDSEAIGAFVDTVFQQAFGRLPDPASGGRDFWINDIQGRIGDADAVAQAPLDIVSGAQTTQFGDDIGTIANRGEAAAEFAAALDAEGRALTDAMADDAARVLSNVMADDQSVRVAESTSGLIAGARPDFQASQLGRFETDVFAEGAAEIVAHDPGTQRLFVTNGDQATMDVLDISDPANPARTTTIDPTDAFAAAAGFTHVEVNDGIVAVGAENGDATANGRVIFYDAQSLDVLNTVEVGVLPDNLQFTPDGNRVVTANEGEQIDADEDGTPEGGDPNGSVSVIDIAGGVANAAVETIDFSQFDGQEDSLRDQGVRIFPNRSASDDLEPEYVAISPDGTQARVVLQENNAFAEVDLTTDEITGLQPLGAKDFAAVGNGLDAKENGEIEIENLPLKGLYQPDQAAAFEQDGETFYVTANEGDDRDFDVSEAGEANLDSRAQQVVADNGLGELEISNIDGDTDGDGQIEALTIFGGRSFAIWDSEGNLVFDSGSEFAEIMAHEIPDGFNSDDEANEKDSESEEAGAEVEGLTLGRIDGALHAFIGLEKPGGVMIYDISTPSDAQFVDYITNRTFDVPLTEDDGSPNPAAGDSGPEGLEFIAAGDSPTGNPVLAVGNEITGTTTLWEFGG